MKVSSSKKWPDNTKDKNAIENYGVLTWNVTIITLGESIWWLWCWCDDDVDGDDDFGGGDGGCGGGCGGGVGDDDDVGNGDGDDDDDDNDDGDDDDDDNDDVDDDDSDGDDDDDIFILSIRTKLTVKSNYSLSEIVNCSLTVLHCPMV